MVPKKKKKIVRKKKKMMLKMLAQRCRWLSTELSAKEQLLQRTRFGNEELKVLERKYKELGSAPLDEVAFATLLSNVGLVDKQRVHRYFQIFDQDGNGLVDFEELAVSMSVLLRGTDDERFKFSFRVLDADNDEKIEFGEYKKFLRTAISAPAAAATTANEGGDDDDDDESSGDVFFENLAKQTFLRADLDQDNLLTWSEFKRAVTSARIVCPSPVRSLAADSGLTVGESELLSLLGKRVKVPRGAVVGLSSSSSSSDEEEFERSFYMLLSGTYVIRSRQDPALVFERGSRKGTFLRQRSLFGGSRATIFETVSASDDFELLEIDATQFEKMVYNSHPDASSLMEKLGERMLKRLKRFEATLKQNGIENDAFSAEQQALMKQWSIAYHGLGVKGKVTVRPTKMLGSSEALSVAYSPGVAEPCLAIDADPSRSFELTARGRRVGVITNSTAVLGLGRLRPEAAAPVMEGKAALFVHFAGLDAFDIQLKEQDNIDLIVDTICQLEPTFGGVNLEDFGAPQCFEIERRCRERMSIPVMHDDAVGTSIVAAAGLMNAAKITDKSIESMRIAIVGVGAAGKTAACYFRHFGVRREQIICVDIDGVVHAGRQDLLDNPDHYLHEVAVDTNRRTLAEAVDGADVFLGLSTGGLLKPDMLLSMRRDPVVYAMANPSPEINPRLAKATRADVIIGTGRSDEPNQLNNVLCFPFIFKGALACQATDMTLNMKMACSRVIADIAAADSRFGRDFIVPKPYDTRLLEQMPLAVIEQAMADGVARKPFSADELRAYARTLRREAARRDTQYSNDVGDDDYAF
jgi:malate dehydrogenase (oxaloacetate-decarboxylating)(NADP+)